MRRLSSKSKFLRGKPCAVQHGDLLKTAEFRESSKESSVGNVLSKGIGGTGHVPLRVIQTEAAGKKGQKEGPEMTSV